MAEPSLFVPREGERKGTFLPSFWTCSEPTSLTSGRPYGFNLFTSWASIVCRGLSVLGYVVRHRNELTVKAGKNGRTETRQEIDNMKWKNQFAQAGVSSALRFWLLILPFKKIGHCQLLIECTKSVVQFATYGNGSDRVLQLLVFFMSVYVTKHNLDVTCKWQVNFFYS